MIDQLRSMDIMLLLMPLFLLLILLFQNITEAAAADHLDCPVSKCRDDGPLIQFPFRLKHDPRHCGHPHFEVSCSSSFNNMTMIKLSSSSGLFPIKTIDYVRQQFFIYDFDGCLPRRLMNFTIPSSSLFQPDSYTDCAFVQRFPSPTFFTQLRKLTLLNCSTEQNFSTWSIDRNFLPIRCLSVPGHQVLAVAPSSSMSQLPVPACRMLVREINFPLRNVNGSMYHCELNNVLLLLWDAWEFPYNWEFPACRKCPGRGRCKVNNSTNQMECHPIIPTHKNKGHGSTTFIVVGVSIACTVLLLMKGVAIFYCVKQSNRIEEKENQIKIERFLTDHKLHVPTRYSYADIKKMTRSFKKKLGEGAFGRVFSGKLPNGAPVAIKVLKDSKGDGEDFVNEVGTIGRIHHINVVRLLGFSAEGGKRAIIYELMPNSSLERFITNENNDNSFDWKTLHHIMTGIAKGIDYLHQGCDQMILHLDIKPHNILLDNDFNPISDFGLAKLCSKEQSVISMTATRGTEGYIAPELQSRNFKNVSHKSDVYSFGILLLEMVGARKKPADTAGDVEVFFPEWIYYRLVQGEILELEVSTEEDAQIAKNLLTVALWCIQWYPVNRPSMKAVVRMLEGVSESLTMPPNPFPSTTQTEPLQQHQVN
ncbi:rust resistance kinase Lr10-like [Rosa rugosa]|uniref:rust resistance kinase Lr10-like n=1 Tax=Rosa rugosa TaxID=74645 RepID=UPI002B4043C0|nr:rust resistance kinase Lr10-like [Rosa rugosa]